MKKIGAFMLLIMLSLLPACNNEQQSDTQVQENNYIVVDPDRGLTCMDFDTVYSMTKDFLDSFYSITQLHESKDFSLYIVNENLLWYTNKKAEACQVPSKSSVYIVYGLSEIKWYENYVYIFIVAQVYQGPNFTGGGFSEGHEFLIENEGGGLTIADWYSGGKGNSSILDFASRKPYNGLYDIDIWENEEWVNEIFLSIIAENSPTSKVVR